MLISLFPTPFDHFHFHPTLGLDPALILTLRHSSFRSWCTMVFKTHVKNSVTLKIVYSSPLRSWIIQDCCRRKLVFLDQFFGKNNLFPHVDPMNTLWTPPQSVIHCWKESYGSCRSNSEAQSKIFNHINVASEKLFYMILDCTIWCFEYSGCELVNSSYVSKWYSIITIMIITMHSHVRIMEMRVLRTPACKCHSHLRACVMVTCVQVS